MKNVTEDVSTKLIKEENLSDEDIEPLRCWDCNVTFTSKHYLYSHLFHHIKQPTVLLKRLILPPLKLTIKSRDNSFEIIKSPSSDSPSPPAYHTKSNLAESEEEKPDNPAEGGDLPEVRKTELLDNDDDLLLDHADITFASDFSDINGIITSPIGNELENDSDTSSQLDGSQMGHSGTNSNNEECVGEMLGNITDSSNSASETEPMITEIGGTDSINETSTAISNTDYGAIPGAEPTPPPEPSPSPSEYPKIRIKTTGLLKDPLESSCTITEITDDNPNGDPIGDSQSNNSHMWSTPSLEDPLKLPDSDDNILSLFNNNDRAKDFGFTSSDSEYMSLDRLDDRNRGAMQLYNPSNAGGQNPLDSLTGLPMQALAQQVSRLQPSGNGMHQQNVLINIQQFPQAPPQAPYQPPPMYHHGPHTGQPMYQPYQYQPPNPMYYPPTPGYPQHMPQQPPQMGQMSQSPMNQPQMNQNQMPQPQMNQPQIMPNNSPQQNMNQMQPPNMQQSSQPYRQPLGPRQQAPRQPVPNQRMPAAPRAPMGPRQPMATRQRAPMPRPRGGTMTAVRGIRPRMPNSPNAQFRNQQTVKRTPEQIQNLQAKKKRFDLLTPDKDDDDCQVICMQPKNTDGLPQIESVQGGTPEPSESSIMHLSDSITLSVRNPQPRPASPKKSDAKAVANILATRGITVTATAKPKEKQDSPVKSPPMPASLNLNGAVSIIPSAKTCNKSSNGQDIQLPTVDLTDDSNSTQTTIKQSNSPQKNNQRPGLPYRCDLCPAQYPNALGLSKHRQNYHKTTGGMCEIGIPLINLKQPGIIQKLGQLGISHYIPLPAAGSDGTFALPIINSRNPANVAALGATTMLSLGPIRTISRPQGNVPNNINKPGVQK